MSVARATLGGVRTRPGGFGRTVLAVLAIALGVALGFAVQLVNHTAISEFTAGVATLAGDADLTVQGGRDGFAESLYPRLARDPAVAVASPVIELDAAIGGQRERLRLVGVDVLRARFVTPALVGSGDTLDLLRPRVVFLDAAAMHALDVRVGDTLAVQSGIASVQLRVAGTVPAQANAALGVMDIGALQDAFAQAGRLTRVDLRLRAGVDAGAAARRLAALLPPGVAVAPPQARADTAARFTRAYRTNLDVLALVALFTGGLLVFATQALAVIRRRGAFALLRSLGLARRRLVALVVGEGALIGLVGALLGLGAGYVLASLAVRFVGVDLGAGLFRGQAPALAMDWRAAVAFGLAGVAAAALGSLVPAQEAARTNPAAALKSGDVDLAWHGRRARLLGLAALVGGSACTLLPPIAGLPLGGYAAIALLLLGTLWLLPDVCAALLALVPAPRRLPRARAVPLRLALARLAHAPAQATLSLAALVVAVALMAAMAIMVASFRASLDAWLGDVLPADAYVRAGRGESAYFPPPLVARVANLPGVARIEPMRSTAILLDPQAPPVALLAREIDPDDPGARLALVARSGAPRTDGESVGAHAGGALPAEPPAWISEAVADRFGWRPGQTVMLPIGGRDVAFRVAGVFRDYARQQGAVVVERRTYTALTGDARADELALWLAPDASVATVGDALRELVPQAALDLATPRELRRVSLAIFDRTFAITYALEAVAIAIGLAGLSSAFGAEVLMRRRELGMLRHVGLTRGQVGAMLASEGLVLATVGVAVGMTLGFVIAQILIRVVNRQSFHWSMDLHVPVSTLGGLAAVLVALAVASAWLASRRALGGEVVRAVREDW